MELLKLPNVRMHKNSGNPPENMLQADAKRLAWEVATKNPLWTVEVHSSRTFAVLCDGEKLGVIGSEWYGSAMKLFVRNDRLAANATRKNSYHTDKVDKAVLKVKKFFRPMDVSERMSKALQEATNTVDHQLQRKQMVVRDHKVPIHSSMVVYGKAHMSQYILWLKETHNNAALDHLTKLEDAQVDMKTIQEVVDGMKAEKTALVVLDSGKYIVKIRDNVQLYDDVTLPYELRAKLGMLKLVEDQAMVTGMGCRVSNEIFVVLLEEEKSDALP